LEFCFLSTTPSEVVVKRGSCFAHRIVFAGKALAALVLAGAPALAQSRSAEPMPTTRPSQTVFIQPDYGGYPGQFPGGFQGRFVAGGVAVRAVAPEDVAQQVTCVLQIDADPVASPYGGGGIDARTVASILHSTPVVEGAVKKVLGDQAAAAKLQDWLVVNAVPTAQRFLELEVIVLKGEQAAGVAPGTASKLLPALCERAEAALRQSADAQRQQAQHRREKVEQDIAAVRQRLADVREKQRKYRAATASISQFGDARYAGNNLRNQRQQYEQQLAGYRSRLKSIEPSSSPLVAEWRGVVELRQKQLDELKEQASAGKASADAVAAQERKVAEARSQLEAARRTAGAEADSRRGRAGEVASLESQIEQAESQLKNVNEQLAKIEDPKVTEMVEELPELQNEENRVRAELTEAMSRADQLRRAGDAGGDVSIRMLDGKAGGQ